MYWRMNIAPTHASPSLSHLWFNPSRRSRPSRRVLSKRLGQGSAATGSAIKAIADGSNGSLNVVITGGSKGLGYCMAKEFLSHGDGVVICGRNPERLEASSAALKELYPEGSIFHKQCNVSSPEDLKEFADFSAEKLNRIDRWINNAGEVTEKKLLSDLEPSDITQVIGTNVVGSMLGSCEAIRLMRAQPQSNQPRYHILNLGFSSWGASFSKSACTHKTTKTALTQLTESLSQELVEAGITSIGVHNLSPGMVLTDLLLKDANVIARRFFNALAEEPETVAAVLVPQIRSLAGTNQGIDYLNPATALARVVGGLPQILFGGRFFDKDGERVVEGGGELRYKKNGVKVLYDIDAKKY
ncbi:hypothetical protein BSKO_01106 [Bryopsis sp. KO-2023]|nr:hypothetical protein BSKO_01106 [Bryopsis sp. KO-2023]